MHDIAKRFGYRHFRSGNYFLFIAERRRAGFPRTRASRNAQSLHNPPRQNSARGRSRAGARQRFRATARGRPRRRPPTAPGRPIIASSAAASRAACARGPHRLRATPAPLRVAADTAPNSYKRQCLSARAIASETCSAYGSRSHRSRYCSRAIGADRAIGLAHKIRSIASGSPNCRSARSFVRSTCRQKDKVVEIESPLERLVGLQALPSQRQGIIAVPGPLPCRPAPRCREVQKQGLLAREKIGHVELMGGNLPDAADRSAYFRARN